MCRNVKACWRGPPLQNCVVSRRALYLSIFLRRYMFVFFFHFYSTFSTLCFCFFPYNYIIFQALFKRGLLLSWSIGGRKKEMP